MSRLPDDVVLPSFVVCLAGYKIIKKLGEGAFSEVVKTQSLKDGKFYACKTMKQTIKRYPFNARRVQSLDPAFKFPPACRLSS